MTSYAYIYVYIYIYIYIKLYNLDRRLRRTTVWFLGTNYLFYRTTCCLGRTTPDMKNVNALTQSDFLSAQSLTRKRTSCFKIYIATKQQIMKKTTPTAKIEPISRLFHIWTDCDILCIYVYI